MWEVRSGILYRDGEAVEQLESSNRSGTFAAPPGILVIHFTAGGSARSSADWFRHPGNKDSSAHIVVERDGSAIQCVALDRIAWHAGKSRWGALSGLNQYSIGIELANWGYLRPSGDGWATSTGKPIAAPYLGMHRNGNPDGSRRPIGWESYPQEQIEAARGIETALVAAFGISEIVGHDDIAPTRKWDPGPAFDMARFRAAVLESRRSDGDNIATVNAENGLNLRSGPGTSYEILTTLANGVRVELLEQDGVWFSVSELDDDHRPVRTGWVHGHYLKIT